MKKPAESNPIEFKKSLMEMKDLAILNASMKNKETGTSYEDKQMEAFDKLQLINNLKNVEGQLKSILSSDMVLASFNQKQKEFIVDMLKNAMFARNVILRYQKGTKYTWRKEAKDWERNTDGSYKKKEMSRDDGIEVEKQANELFKNYMIEPLTLSILERNRKDNFLLKLLVTGTNEAERQEEEAKQTAESIADRIKNRIFGQKGEEIAE